MFRLFFRLGLGLLFRSLQGIYLGGHLICPLLSVCLARSYHGMVRGHFMMLIEVGTHLIEGNPGLTLYVAVVGLVQP